MKSPAVVNFSSTPHSVELREFARPVPGADDVILAVEAVGVCGSDLHQWTGHHSWPVNYPVVGDDAFRTGTGVHAAAVIKAITKGADWLADRAAGKPLESTYNVVDTLGQMHSEPWGEARVHQHGAPLGVDQRFTPSR